MSELQRYGLEWKSDTDFIATPMDDGYWTPWHIAQVRLTTVQAENEALRERVAGLVGALEWLRGAINATPENDKVQAGTWISTKHPRIEQIDAILAAHRKQGGEV